MPLAQTFEDPPMLEHLLLENPWPAVALLLAAALVLRLAARRAAKPKLNYAVLAAVLLAGGVYLASSLVTTQRESVAEATRGLLDATVARDTQALGAMIGDQALLTHKDGQVLVDVGQLRDEVTTVTERFPFSRHQIKDLAVAPVNDLQALAYLDVRTWFIENKHPPEPTTWQITWKRDHANDPWRITEIQWIAHRGQTPQGKIW